MRSIYSYFGVYFRVASQLGNKHRNNPSLTNEEFVTRVHTYIYTFFLSASHWQGCVCVYIWYLRTDDKTVRGTYKLSVILTEWEWYQGLEDIGTELLTLNVRGPGFIGLTRSISWLLMPWLLTSPGRQQPWYWQCRISRLFLFEEGFQLLASYQCGEMTQNVNICLCSHWNI